MAHKSKIGRSIDSLYIGKSTLLKVFLLGGVVAISVVFVWYTFNVIDQLQLDTRSQVERLVRLWQMTANSPTSGDELQFIFDEIIVKANFPIVVLDSHRQPIHWRNIDGVAPNDTSQATMEYLKKVAAGMVKDHGEYPLHFGENYVNYFCYGDPKVVEQLRLMPFIEIGIVLAFMIVGIIGFQNIRRSEERHIWVGMAKETAHQLGTPITSLMGWLDLLPAELEEGVKRSGMEKALHETVANMQLDVERLEKVANRFGKIGSAPEMKTDDLNRLVGETVEYYRRRVPFEGRGVQINFSPGDVGRVAFSYDLIGWALENMIKNAIQAVDARSGRIDVHTGQNDSGDMAVVQIADNGQGISPAAARKIFRAGFTTKKRGWGLGLTLVKRIIEEYHGGRIHLKRSHPGETVFEMLLPSAEKSKSPRSPQETAKG